MDNQMPMLNYFALTAIVALSSVAWAQSTTAPAIPFAIIGKLATRNASEIPASSWSIGGETLDRDYAIYANYKSYLGPLGAKSIRVQCGWAKCEQQRGVYDFAWLDEVVADALSQGVVPWLETSYGNPLYRNGGGPGLGDGIPTSEDALAGWDGWVKALVGRYKDRVHEWEVWNEPDLSKTITPADYAAFFIRTAEIIRREQPDARIYAVALAGKTAFLEGFLQQVRDKGKLDLISAVTVHGYPTNPDDTGLVDAAREIVGRYSQKIQIRQGETGCPSTLGSFGALRGHPWTERTQAKWDTRRMLSHYAKGVPFNLFMLMELYYQTPDGVRVNTKGLLKSRPDKTVDRPKPAYFAAQNIFAIFDDTLAPMMAFAVQSSAERLVAQGYTQRGSDKQIITVWLGGEIPSDRDDPTLVDVTLTNARIAEPVYVDLVSGSVYAIPQDVCTRQAGGSLVLKGLPVFDYPTAIAERSLIRTK